jgi:glutathione peroxidase
LCCPFSPKDRQWNFEKFLVNKEGVVVHRWAPITTPEAIDAEIAKIL